MSHINLIPGDQGVRLSTLSPKYLHTNSTSHTWPFSAIAELIDNAYDPDVNASQLWIDVRRYEHEYCLTFTDNGAGMNSLKLHKMLSFGFCEKVANKDHMPVGHYGNGFKSGSMRLGKDALVFTTDGDTRSVGFLSQTYLEAVQADTILVPIVTWDSEGIMIERSDGDKALQDIYKYSLFKNHKALMSQFEEISTSKGTRIIVYHIRKTTDGKPEFDFRTDFTDIRIPDDTDVEVSKYKHQERQNHIPESDFSLRAYCSILYLRPRMQILLRNKKVRTTVIAKSLSKTEIDLYKPQGVRVDKPIKITFGFSQNKNHYGIMMYHRNRLIKPYVRVGYQLKANNQGVGVIGVIQCDFLQPTHNKQDFDYTKTYRSAMSAVGGKLNDYWNEKKGRQATNSNLILPEPKEVDASPDQLWVQCDNPTCLKWRKLPGSVKPESLPDKWYCRNHPEPSWQSCDVAEQLEEETESVIQPYVKKQKRRLEKEMEERKKREKEAKGEKERELERKRIELQKKEQELQRLIKTVEEKSNKQKETLQKQNNINIIKKEAPSPQKLQVKLSALPQTQSPTQKRYLVQQSGSQNVVLTPISNTLASPKVAASPAAVQPPAGTVPVVMKAVTPSGKVINIVQNTLARSVQSTPAGTGPNTVQTYTLAKTGPNTVQTYTLAKTAPNTVQNNTGIKIIKVVSPAGAPNMVIQSPASATKTQLVTSQPLQQIVTLPKIVSVAGAQTQTSTNQYVLVRSLPSTQVQTKTIQVQSSSNSAPKSIQIISPTTPSSSTPANYKPLESLKEVNKHAAETSISPVSVVLDTPSIQAVLPEPQKRDSITMYDRYRLIAPSSQPDTVVSATPPAPTPAPTPAPPPVAATVQYVRISPKTSQTTTTQSAQTLVTKVKSEAQTSPVRVTPGLHAQVQSLAHAQVVASSQTVTVMVKKEPQDTPRAVPGVKRPLTNSAVNGHSAADDDVIIIDPPAKKPRVIPNGVANGIDKEILDKIATMDDMEVLSTLVSRTQQLFKLRENVCKLLRVLVPELEVDDRKEILGDTTIDDLLGQVLAQSIASNANSS